MIPNKNRFHRRNHVNSVYKKGKSVRSGSLSLKFMISNSDDHKFAVSISKKVAKSAVTRNRIRRRVFEQIRTNENIPKGMWGVVGVFDESLVDAPAKDLSAQINSLISKAAKAID